MISLPRPLIEETLEELRDWIRHQNAIGEASPRSLRCAQELRDAMEQEPK